MTHLSAASSSELSSTVLDALLSFGERLTQCMSLGELYEALCALMCRDEVYGATHAVVLEGDPQSDVLFTVSGTSPHFEGARWSRSERMERVLGGQIVALKDATRTSLGEVCGLFSPPLMSALYMPLSATKLLVALHPRQAYFSREHVLATRRVVPMVSQKFRHLAQHQVN